MLARALLIFAVAVTLPMGGGLAFCADDLGGGGSELVAAGALGRGDAAVLQLVRELTQWKTRAEAAESLLTKSGPLNTADAAPTQPNQARVLNVLESERVVIVSAGRLSGAVLGSLLSVGEGVVAKVVESRETVAAAVVDQGYGGRVGALEGSLVRLLVTRP